MRRKSLIQALVCYESLIASFVQTLYLLMTDLRYVVLPRVQGIQIGSANNKSINIRSDNFREVMRDLRKITSIHRWNLKEIDISYWDFPDQGIKTLFREMKKYQSGLPRLNLSFLYCLSEIRIQRLRFYIAKSFSRLRKLTLVARSCPIKSNDLAIFASSISRGLIDLQHLGIGFVSCDKLTDDGINLLGFYTGRRLLQLKTLSLEFETCKITSQGITTLSSRLKRSFFLLKDLKLHFTECERVNDLALMLIGIGLKHRRNLLHNLSLDFTSCKMVTDNGIESLVTGVGPHLAQLKQLNLNFNIYAGITDTAVAYVGIELQKRPTSLQKLSLGFSGCNRITDKGILNLRSSLSDRLTHIQHLTLKFSMCEKITYAAVEQLGLDFRRYFKNLEQVTLRFACLEKKDRAEQLRDLLDFIPTLTLKS